VRKLSDDEVLSAIDEEIRNSVGFYSGELASQRKTALDYYHGEPFGNEVEGRSAYVSRDVADTIEWIMPSMMSIFYGGDTIVKFEPQNQNDVEKAKQATDYVNYIFQRQNDGFLSLYTFVKDALLSKNGFLKVYYEEYKDGKKETYDNLNDIELANIVQGAEVIEHTQNPDGSHAVTVRKTKQYGKCCVEPVPPEEIFVNKGAKAPLHKNRFVAHRRQVTLSELREMGFDVPDDFGGDETNFSEERIARFAYDDTDELNDVNREKKVWLSECYLQIDVDGDGISELRRVITAGKVIFENEECDTIPFVTMTPIIMPHKLYGMSIADLVMDLQLLKSTIFRQLLDNMYLANNGRYMALDGMVNIDDLLTSRPGGIVRVKTFDAVKPMQPPVLGSGAFGLLEYVDTVKENRTGVTRYNQGIDADSLNKTATGINQIMSAAQARIQLIARVFAETGIKDLFYAILECVQKHQKEPQMIQLRDQFVPMDPREWTNKFDMTVTVGLGTGSKESQMAQLFQILQMQLTMMGGGLPVVNAQNIYNAAIKLLEAGNIKGGEMFFTDPSRVQQQPRPDPEMAKVMMEKELQEKELQVKAREGQQKLQQNAQIAVMDVKKEIALEQMRQQGQREVKKMDIAAALSKGSENPMQLAEVVLQAMNPPKPPAPKRKRGSFNGKPFDVVEDGANKSGTFNGKPFEVVQVDGVKKGVFNGKSFEVYEEN
jgi:hypothetical protein